ncbi:GspE/PulE family protein [Vibrio crassostreae]|uniref:GspE/PulE family protein n=1 Tax=Vibrio crassostreae TaxID=246167 RepID=UPI001B301DAD|nr:ATPase, T2SS/T4P/T4SS family [Vibrio crassostreae]
MKAGEIKAVTDLGEEWTILGVENGDRSIVNLSKKDRERIVFVRTTVRGEDGEDTDLVYIIGHRAWITSNTGSETLKKLADANLDRRVQPIQKKQLLVDIYKEWEKRVKDAPYANQQVDEKSYENVQEVEDVLVECLKDGVSDIHIEVKETTAQIRRRINGTIKEYKVMTPQQGNEWGRTIYNVLTTVAGTNFKPHIPQDALIDKDFGFVRLRGRVATAPANPNGFTMVIRLLKMQNATKPLSTEQLGYSERERFKISSAMSKTKGITCVAGTTGSGKSTTLQNLIMTKIMERNGELAVMTVEDPPEYVIPQATQIPVIRDSKGDASNAFSSAIRTALRMDPDLLMVGEVRDAQSAALVQKIVETGHPVFTTIHASGCIQTIARFENLEVSRETMSSPEFISGFFYQKLLPKICPNCAKRIEHGRVPVRMNERDLLSTLKIMNKDMVNQHYNAYRKNGAKTNFLRHLQDKRIIEPDQAELVASSYKRFNNPYELEALYERIDAVADMRSDNIIFKGDGCKACKQTGIIGRTVVSEGMTPDMAMLEMIGDNADRDLMIYWKKNKDGKFAIEDAVEKMRLGLVDPVDIEHEVGQLGSTII